MISDFESIFQKKGYSVTKPRKQILSVLGTYPQSIESVCTVLRKKSILIDPATVYRTVELLTTLGVVAKTQFEDKAARYELCMGIPHHHHLICEKCGSIEDVPLDEMKLLKRIEQQTTFKIKKHTLEFFGYCQKCQ